MGRPTEESHFRLAGTQRVIGDDDAIVYAPQVQGGGSVIRALVTSVALAMTACAPAIPPCGPTTCEGGCCDPRGLCVAGRTKRICGLGGNACVACEGADLCVEGACVAPAIDGGLDAGSDAGLEPDAGRRRTVLVRRTDEAWTNDGGISSIDLDLNAMTQKQLLYEDENGEYVIVEPAPQSGPVLRFDDVPEGPYVLVRGTDYVVSDVDSLELGARTIGRRNPLIGNGTLSVTLTGATFQQSDVVLAHSFGAGTLIEQFRNSATDGGVLTSTATLSNQPLAFVLRNDSDELTVFVRRTINTGGSSWSAAVLAGTVAAPDLGQNQSASVTVPLTQLTQQRWPLELRSSGFEQFVRDVHPAATTTVTQAILYSVPSTPPHTTGGDFEGRSAPLASLTNAAGRPDVRQEITVGTPSGSAPLFADGRLFASVPLTLSGRTLSKGFEALATTTTDGGVLDATLSPPRFLRINQEPADVNRTGVSQNPVLEWSAPALGAPTTYVVVITRLMPQGTTLTEGFSLRLRTPFTRLKVPGVFLETGAPYVAQVVAVANPGFDNKRFPFHFSTLSSRASAITSIFIP